MWKSSWNYIYIYITKLVRAYPSVQAGRQRACSGETGAAHGERPAESTDSCETPSLQSCLREWPCLATGLLAMLLRTPSLPPPAVSDAILHGILYIHAHTHDPITAVTSSARGWGCSYCQKWGRRLQECSEIKQIYRRKLESSRSAWSPPAWPSTARFNAWKTTT